MDATLLWNTILTVLIGAVGYFMSTKFRELDRISILLNRTREEVARDHLTRAEFRQDMKELLERFDRLEVKIDNLKNRPNPG
jgi:cell division FtsZ-interacting protein ZapD